MKTPRRDFIIKSAMAATAVVHNYKSIGAAHPFGMKQFSTAGSRGPATVSFFSKMLPGVGYDEMATLLAGLGFDGIDLTVRKEGHVLPENVVRDLPLAAAAAKKAGLKINMITTDILDADDKYIAPVLKTASSLGIQHYRLGRRFYDGKKSMQENFSDINARYKKLAKLNQQYNIRGECQNHSGDGFGAPLWDLWEVLKDVDPQWVGVQYDILHATIEGANSWPLAFNVLKPWIGTFDIKDFYWKKTEGKWAEEVIPLGEGMVDFKKYFALLKENDIHGPFSLHCEYLTEKDDLHSKTEKIKKDLITLRGWLQEAGL